MIVDDDAMIILIHSKMITNSAFHPNPLFFFNGREALDHILNEKDESKAFLILLDINMPVMNGWEFLNILKEQPVAHEIQVAIVTSSIDMEDMEKAKQYRQVIQYIEKPLDREKLEELKKHAAPGTFFQ